MKGTTRTILAFAGAPAVAPVILGVVAACTRPPEERLTWIEAFRQYSSAAAIVTYGASYTLGTLIFLTLRALRKESAFSYGSIGALAGILGGLVAAQDSSLREALVGGLFLGLLGCAVATTFALIRGNPKKKEPNQMPGPTPDGVAHH